MFCALMKFFFAKVVEKLKNLEKFDRFGKIDR